MSISLLYMICRMRRKWRMRSTTQRRIKIALTEFITTVKLLQSNLLFTGDEADVTLYTPHRSQHM